ncbi:hypothetical protein CDAR_591611 [Caerostris darwini]|uniref:Uncharacterized protein n=1 Tax=Caerostris darwini TaxID=1538125 RepID=A0AAV4PI89_9ARAC|nr:hypothetical protein CDAR_591611 [Caerostris darwini]
MDSYDNLQTSKTQRENSHVNNKCYPKQLEYQRSDKNQYYSKVPKVEYGKGPTIHFDRTYKRSTTQNDRKPALSGVPSQSRRDPIYMDKSLPSCYGCGAPGFGHRQPLYIIIFSKDDGRGHFATKVLQQSFNINSCFGKFLAIHQVKREEQVVFLDVSVSKLEDYSEFYLDEYLSYCNWSQDTASE